MAQSSAEYLAVIRAERKKGKEARLRRKNRYRRQRPWKLLQEEWFEQIVAVWGKDSTQPSKWAEAEYSLARKLVKQFEIDELLTMVRRFLNTRHERGHGVPGLKLFWTMRDAIASEVRGQTRQRIDKNHDEYDAESAKKSPKVGWGTFDSPRKDSDEYDAESAKKSPKVGW